MKIKGEKVGNSPKVSTTKVRENQLNQSLGRLKNLIRKELKKFEVLNTEENRKVKKFLLDIPQIPKKIKDESDLPELVNPRELDPETSETKPYLPEKVNPIRERQLNESLKHLDRLIKDGLKEEADAFKKQIEAAGGKVELK
jgi:hypothetical protein